MSYRLLSQNYRRTYVTNSINLASLFCILIWILVIATPFFLQFYDQQIFTKPLIYYEQPQITSQQDVIVSVVTQSENLFYTNIIGLDSFGENTLLGPTVKIGYQDIDSILNEDVLNIDLSFLADTSTIQKVIVIVPLTYKLSKVINFEWDDFVIFTIVPLRGLSSAVVAGKLKFNQKKHFNQGNDIYQNYLLTQKYSNPIFNQATYQGNFQKFINDQMNKDYKVLAEYQTYVQDGDTTLKNPRIQIRCQIDAEQFSFIQTTLSGFRFMWMNYFSYFIVFLFFGEKIKNFVYENKIIQSTVLNDLRLNY